MCRGEGGAGNRAGVRLRRVNRKDRDRTRSCGGDARGFHWIGYLQRTSICLIVSP